MRNGVVCGDDRDKRIEGKGARAEIGFGAGRQDKLRATREERSAGGILSHGLKGEFGQNLTGSWIGEGGFAIDHAVIQPARYGERSDKGRDQAAAGIAFAHNADRDARGHQIGATGAIADDALTIHGQRAVFGCDTVEFAIPALQRSGQRQSTITGGQRHILCHCHACRKAGSQNRHTIQHRLHSIPPSPYSVAASFVSGTGLFKATKPPAPSQSGMARLRSARVTVPPAL